MHIEGRASALGLRAAPILIIISRISVIVVVGAYFLMLADLNRIRGATAQTNAFVKGYGAGT
jgi:hypothetical protein